MYVPTLTGIIINIDDMNNDPEKTLHSIRRFLDLKNIGLGTIFKVIE